MYWWPTWAHSGFANGSFFSTIEFIIKKFTKIEYLLNTIAYESIELIPHHIFNGYLSLLMGETALQRQVWGANLSTFDGIMFLPNNAHQARSKLQIELANQP